MQYLAKLAKRLARVRDLALLTALGMSACVDNPGAPVSPTPPSPDVVLAACLTSGNAWINQAFTAQTGTFTATYDVTPSTGAVDGVTGLGPATATDYSSLAAIVRFNTSGKVDARNGGAYAAASSISYGAGLTYHVRVVVNVPTRTYSAYVTPPGGAELTVGANYAFRTDQAGATSVADFGARTSTGSLSVCGLAINGGGAPAPTVATVTVSPKSAGIRVGGTSQLTAVAKDSTGTVLSGVVMTWASRNSAIATVSASGLVTGLAVGTAYILASGGGKSDSAAVTVSPVPVASVTVSPSSASLAVGATQQFAATTKDSAGNTLTGRIVTWSSSNATVAAVTPGGLVTALVTGTATITATSEGKTGTASLTVTAPAPPPAGCTPTGSGVCRYVDGSSGNDANSGSSSAPYRTIQKAASVVNAGDVVIVRNGTYTGGTNVVDISRSGSASAWITFKAENQWGAVIDGNNNASVTGVEVRSQYIRIEGFEIRNTSRYGIEAYGGANVVTARNHVHHIGRICTSTSGGIVGINAYVPNMTIEQNVVHDVGRFATGENGCSNSNSYYQNHDHGVYQGEGDNLIVRNNVFYNMQRGWAIQRYSGSGHVVTNLQIVNNTFVGANPYKDGQIIIATGVTGLVITNNIFYQPRNAAIWFDNAGTVTGTIANNMVYGATITTGSSGAVVTGTITADPRFVSVGSFDVHLQSGSPAIDAGLTLSVVTNDMGGTLRPQGARYDLGAWER